MWLAQQCSKKRGSTQLPAQGPLAAFGPLPTCGQQLIHLHPECLGASLGGVLGWICPGRSSSSLARASIPHALRADTHVWTARCPSHFCPCRRTCATGSCGIMGWGFSVSPLISLGLDCKGLGISGGFPGSSAGKESTCNAGNPNSWVRKISWRRDRLPTPVFLDFSSDSDDKQSACNAGDLGSVSRLRRSPGGGHGDLPQYSCLENPHGHRSLMGYSPWGREESDMAEQLSTLHFTKNSSFCDPSFSEAVLSLHQSAVQSGPPANLCFYGPNPCFPWGLCLCSCLFVTQQSLVYRVVGRLR